MKLMLWDLRMRERLADILLGWAWRVDPSRPVLLRSRPEGVWGGDAWVVWCEGQRLACLQRGSVPPVPGWRPRFWS